MKNLLLCCFWLLNCQPEKQEAKEDIKEVREVVVAEGKLRQGEERELIVRGKITGNLFLLGKGAYRLSDIKQPGFTITVVSKDGIVRVKGDTLIVNVLRNEILRINGSAWSVYNEL